MLDVVAHHFGGDHRLFRHRNIAGAGGHHGDDSLAVFLPVAAATYRARQRLILDLGHFLLYRGQLLCTGPRRQDVAAVFGQTRKDGRHLGRSLARTEDHFGHPVAQGAMVVQVGESQIFEGKMAQAINGGVGGKLAPAHLVEEFADGVSVQGRAQVAAESRVAFDLM